MSVTDTIALVRLPCLFAQFAQMPHQNLTILDMDPCVYESWILNLAWQHGPRVLMQVERFFFWRERVDCRHTLVFTPGTMLDLVHLVALVHAVNCRYGADCRSALGTEINILDHDISVDLTYHALRLHNLVRHLVYHLGTWPLTSEI